MLPRDRVLLALNHQEPDRIPIDLGGTLVSSITVPAYDELVKSLGIHTETPQVLDLVLHLPYLDERLLERFHVDTRPVQMPPSAVKSIAITECDGYYEFYNKWGAKLRKPIDGGLYFDYVDFPIKEPSLDAFLRYAWPPSNPPEFYRQLGEQAAHLYNATDYAVVGGVVIGGGIFEQPARLMGMENFYIALASEPDLADRVMEKITDIYIQACNDYLDEVGKYIQVFVYWDDVCGQDGWLINPKIYQNLVKPKQKRLVEAIRERTEAKLFYHGDGSVYELIPHLIEIGFDIINPVQVSARGMDTSRLKKEFGKDIVFWGGGVDTQYILPYGTPAQVAEETKRRIDDLAPGGGFVFGAVHNIQAFVPPQNIIAAFDTAFAYGKY
jgi:uroporphyrinogen decarboxylase